MIMLEDNFEKISSVVLQSCECNKLNSFQERAEELLLNQTKLYNGSNECNFIESLNKEIISVEKELKTLKSSIWDSVFSTKVSLIDIECSTIDIRKHMDTTYFKEIKDRMYTLAKKQEKYKELCVKFQQLIEDVSHFFESKTTTGVRCEDYLIVEGVCKLPKNIILFDDKSNTSIVPIQETTKKLLQFLKEKLVVMRWDLVESKSSAFDLIFSL